MTDAQKKRNYKYYIYRSNAKYKQSPRERSGYIGAIIIVLVFIVLVVIGGMMEGK